MEPWGDMSYEMKIYKRSQNEKTRWTQWTQDDLLADSDGDQLLELAHQDWIYHVLKSNRLDAYNHKMEIHS